MTTWGVVATIKAPLRDALGFAAWHVEAGAHRLYLYLDDADTRTGAMLSAHPKCRAMLTDAAWWAKRGRRPDKHQVRQTRNATHAYRRAGDVDWLAHIDVDEFLVAACPLADLLAALPPDVLTARIRPMEVLADGDGTAFKAWVPPGPDRARLTAALYPNYGPHVTGGFLSHLAGKVFLRTGLPDVAFRIHNVFRGEDQNPGPVELDAVALAHLHTTSWAHWVSTLRYRLEHGSYRAELAPAPGGRSLHALLSDIDRTTGEAGLRAFFDEVVADTPRLRDALAERGLLRRVDLGLDTLIAKHFPGVAPDW